MMLCLQNQLSKATFESGYLKSIHARLDTANVNAKVCNAAAQQIHVWQGWCAC